MKTNKREKAPYQSNWCIFGSHSSCFTYRKLPENVIKIALTSYNIEYSSNMKLQADKCSCFCHET